uniref:Protein MMS22-like N-terminal domain-containing protein n=2 Tax=Amphimedon queenslandica TaxID=400682 RepID=A0A1X7SSU5_AMPQE
MPLETDCHVPIQGEFSVLCGTSFELFLNLLSKCLSDGSQIWRQLKTRIYSKISRKKVLELSSEGLSNMISVFLTLCHSCDQEDIIEVGQQFYTSLEYRQLSSTSEKNLKIIWKGILLLLMVYHFRGISIFSMAILSSIRKNIEILADVYSKQSHSILVTDVLYNTLSTILEGLHQLLVNRCIHVQQLIGPYFRDLIKGMGKLFLDILRFIINMVSTIK